MDKLRETVNEPMEKKFGTSVFGFNKEEVLDYINNLNKNMKNSIYNFELKLTEQSNAMTMALRERDNLAVKAEELEKKVEYLSSNTDEEKSNLVAENNELKLRVEELSELGNRIELLSAEITGLKSRCEFAEREKQGLIEEINKKDEIIAVQCKKNAESERILKNEHEKLKTQYESTRKLQTLNIENAKDYIDKLMNIIEQL